MELVYAYPAGAERTQDGLPAHSVLVGVEPQPSVEV